MELVDKPDNDKKEEDIERDLKENHETYVA
jgi:hypothetical protein